VHRESFPCWGTLTTTNIRSMLTSVVYIALSGSSSRGSAPQAPHVSQMVPRWNTSPMLDSDNATTARSSQRAAPSNHAALGWWWLLTGVPSTVLEPWGRWQPSRQLQYSSM
jgi:hypothetical protein